MTLRIGDRRVGVRCDTDALGALVRERFAELLAPGVAPEALSLRAGEPGSRGSGMRRLSLVYWGSCIVGRAERPEDLLPVVHGWLRSLDALERWSGPYAGVRVFAKDGRAVLVDWAQPALVADRRLAAAGVHEVPGYRVLIAADGTPVLPGLQVEGWVLRAADGGPAAQLVRAMELMSEQSGPAVFQAMAAEAAAGRMRSVGSDTEARSAISALLG